MTGIEKVIAEENEKNRLHNIKLFQHKNECPFCEGYGEVLIEEGIYHECDNCEGSGEWMLEISAEDLHIAFPDIGK